jgi:hypothetical protein
MRSSLIQQKNWKIAPQSSKRNPQNGCCGWSVLGRGALCSDLFRITSISAEAQSSTHRHVYARLCIIANFNGGVQNRRSRSVRSRFPRCRRKAWREQIGRSQAKSAVGKVSPFGHGRSRRPGGMLSGASIFVPELRSIGARNWACVKLWADWYNSG